MNWGNKLLVTFLVFGAGMSYLVYRSIHTNFELVEKDYYKTELKYQDVIDAAERANRLGSPVKIEQTNAGILFQLPVEMKGKNTEGDVWFYCSYDSNKDRKFSMKMNEEGRQLFTANAISPGTYTVKISWKAEGISYYSEKALTVVL